MDGLNWNIESNSYPLKIMMVILQSCNTSVINVYITFMSCISSLGRQNKIYIHNFNIMYNYIFICVISYIIYYINYIIVRYDDMIMFNNEF